MKNLNAIVWLYRGETKKYKDLLKEYRKELDNPPSFTDKVTQLTEELTALRAEAKNKVEAAQKRDKKKVQAEEDEKIAAKEETLTMAREAVWLYEKFGEGVYADIPGLCKIATSKEIKEKGFSLTPGAYVGVAQVADDGVDFTKRMKEIHTELLSLQAESNELMKTISKNMKGMGL